jgi:twitching motility protein PilT
LAALLEHLNATRTCRICTVENPIGIRLTPKRAVVRQLQVGRDAPDVAGGIASALGHGLDVLFVSPGSDLNRAQELFAEMSAAETGHLVIIEMGADSPESVVQQIMSYFPAEQQAVRRRLAGVLRAVSVQVLLRRADGKGRVAAHDLLIPDDETRRAIAEGGAIPASALAKPDCRSLTESIRRLRDTGIVTAGEAERVLAPRK